MAAGAGELDALERELQEAEAAAERGPERMPVGNAVRAELAAGEELAAAAAEREAAERETAGREAAARETAEREAAAREAAEREAAREALTEPLTQAMYNSATAARKEYIDSLLNKNFNVSFWQALLQAENCKNRPLPHTEYIANACNIPSEEDAIQYARTAYEYWRRPWRQLVRERLEFLASREWEANSFVTSNEERAWQPGRALDSAERGGFVNYPPPPSCKGAYHKRVGREEYLESIGSIGDKSPRDILFNPLTVKIFLSIFLESRGLKLQIQFKNKLLNGKPNINDIVNFGSSGSNGSSFKMRYMNGRYVLTNTFDDPAISLSVASKAASDLVRSLESLRPIEPLPLPEVLAAAVAIATAGLAATAPPVVVPPPTNPRVSSAPIPRVAADIPSTESLAAAVAMATAGLAATATVPPPIIPPIVATPPPTNPRVSSVPIPRVAADIPSTESLAAAVVMATAGLAAVAPAAEEAAAASRAGSASQQQIQTTSQTQVTPSSGRSNTRWFAQTTPTVPAVLRRTADQAFSLLKPSATKVAVFVTFADASDGETLLLVNKDADERLQILVGDVAENETAAAVANTLLVSQGLTNDGLIALFDKKIDGEQVAGYHRDYDAKPLLQQVQPAENRILFGPDPVGIAAGEFYSWVRISAVSDYGLAAAHPERRNNILQTGIQYLRSKENRRYEVPAWQKDVFGAAPDKSVAASELARHILMGQKYATEDTVWNSADMEVYRQLEQEYNQATGAAKFELFQKLKRNFPDSTVRIQDGKQTTTEMIPNPYRAAASRHSLVSFAQPVPLGLSVSDKAIVEQNMKVLKKLVPSVMIQDKPMSTAILESLWFCGRNPDLRDTPRCFPARLLGEIREWTESRKLQAKQSKLAQEVLDSSDWKAMRTWIDAIKRNWRGFSAASASASSAGSSSASGSATSASASSGSASSSRTGHRSYSMLSSGRPMRSLGEILRDDGDRFYPYSIIQPIIPGPFRR